LLDKDKREGLIDLKVAESVQYGRGSHLLKMLKFFRGVFLPKWEQACRLPYQEWQQVGAV